MSRAVSYLVKRLLSARSKDRLTVVRFQYWSVAASCRNIISHGLLTLHTGSVDIPTEVLFVLFLSIRDNAVRCHRRARYLLFRFGCVLILLSCFLLLAYFCPMKGLVFWWWRHHGAVWKDNKEWPHGKHESESSCPNGRQQPFPSCMSFCIKSVTVALVRENVAFADTACTVHGPEMCLFQMECHELLVLWFSNETCQFG